jgi:hypothetical protein
MRSQSLALIALLGLAASAYAQEVTDRFADGLIPGAYLRVGAGTMAPVNAQGSLRDWKPGNGASVAWESWDAGQTGVSRLGFAISAAYSTLSLDSDRFLTEFTSPLGGSVNSVSGRSAGVLEVTTNLIFRVPAPYIMPHVTLGLGFIDWRPGEIRYTGTAGNGTTKQQHRSGGEVAIGGGLDKHIYDRYAVFGEATYVYGYTRFGGGYGTPTGVCATSGCDALNNTTVTTLRGGLRIRMMR